MKVINRDLIKVLHPLRFV